MGSVWYIGFNTEIMNVDDEGTTICLVFGRLEQMLFTLVDIHPHQSNVLGVPSL